MFEWFVDKHKTNETWLMDVYIKFLAPVIIVVQLSQQQWLTALGILAVVCFMFPMRRVARLQSKVSKREAERIATGFLKWLEKQPSRSLDEQFDKWWQDEYRG